MASCKDMNMMACLSVMVVMVGLMKGATAATEYIVGDSLGWTLPPNTSFYSDWAASKTFQIGDTVTFKVTGNNNSLAEATKEEYLNCSNPGLWLSSAGGDLTSTIPLKSAGSLYFVCTIGDNCERGQKVNITVASGAHDTVASILLWLISSMLIISFTYM